MFKQGTFIVLLMLLGGMSRANTNDDVRAWRKEGAQQSASVTSEKIETLGVLSAQNQSAHETLIDSLMKGAISGLPDKKQTQSATGAVLFVSFSMSDALLLALADEASRFHIPVVINGLVEGDFKKTITTFTRLHDEAKKQHLQFQGVSIDPVWFEQFQITSVPALVVTARPATCEAQKVCQNQAFDVVYGNASIKNGLELIASKGDAEPRLAQKILEDGHV